MSGDRRAIEGLFARYARAIDTHELELLADVFTEDAWLDFREVSGIAGRFPEVLPWLREVMARYVALHHVVTNVELSVRGAEGEARSLVRAMHVSSRDDGLVGFELGGVYEDRLELTDRGFRIAARTLRHVYTTRPVAIAKATRAPR